MTMYIISDAEQQKSVIADDETGRCYGYITSGPGHEELLQAFMDGLATHVAAYEPHELSALWDSFTETVNELNASLQSAELDASEEHAPEVVPPDGDTETADGETGVEPPATTPVETGGDEGDEENPTSRSNEPSAESENSHGTSPMPVTMPCFNCDGSGTAPVTGGKCGVCDGTGKIEHTPTQPANA